MFKREDFSIVSLYGTIVIQAETKEFGKILLLNGDSNIPEPLEFKNHKEADLYLINYFKTNNIK